ncbi:MAG: cupin domain-containing protein [Saprospiraceae bacterium]|nr:cupin domain-containing protein [Saprospiraceae bacterium]
MDKNGNGMTAEKIIEWLDLKPLTFEGGYFRRTYLSEKIKDGKSLCSAIYYLITPSSYSRIHRLPQDELFHFYLGDPVELMQLSDDGKVTVVQVGNDLAAGQRPQVLVPAGTWQGSQLKNGGNFALLGTTMSPAFAVEDFSTPDNLPLFLEKYPTRYHQQIISMY